MTRQKKAAAQRALLVERAMMLFGTMPPTKLTRRQLARHLEVSSAALGRCFADEDDLLLAAVETLRGEVGNLARQVVESSGSAAERLERLVGGWVELAQRRPALPRLLFSEQTLRQDAVGAVLRHIASMMLELGAQLWRGGQGDGTLPAAGDPRQGAALLLGAAHGLLWQRQLELTDATGVGESLSGLLRQLRGDARGALGSAAAEVGDARDRGPRADGLRALDVRPLLERGVDPLQQILETLGAVGRAGVLVITAPFRPEPLLALLGRQGHAVHLEQHEGSWTVEVVNGGEPAVEDLRDLEPPEPLQQVLEGLEALSVGEVYLARLPRYPRLLVQQLEQRGASWAVHEMPDGSALLRLWKPR